MNKKLDLIKKMKFNKSYLISETNFDFRNFLRINNVPQSDRAQENTVNCRSQYCGKAFKNKKCQNEHQKV